VKAAQATVVHGMKGATLSTRHTPMRQSCSRKRTLRQLPQSSGRTQMAGLSHSMVPAQLVASFGHGDQTRSSWLTCEARVRCQRTPTHGEHAPEMGGGGSSPTALNLAWGVSVVSPRCREAKGNNPRAPHHPSHQSLVRRGFSAECACGALHL